MNPYNETIDNPINYFIQEDMLQKQLNGTGITYDVVHDWRPEYGTGNGTDSGYEDIANAKPKIFFDKDQVTVRDFIRELKSYDRIIRSYHTVSDRRPPLTTEV